MKSLQSSLKDALKILTEVNENPLYLNLIIKLAALFAHSFQAGNKILICGNGGSACDAMHFAEELTGRYRSNRKPLPALALTDAAHITCVANDYGFDVIFSRMVAAFGKSDDWLIVLSTSGNSLNIIRAVETAKEMKIKTLALLGKEGGKLKGQCDFEFIIPAATSDRIQEIHMLILHMLVEGIERILFPENY